jgi:low affinity Fe/Cu permease
MKINLAEKIADWLFGVAKYVVTAAIIASVLTGFGETWKLYVFGAIVVVSCLVAGVWIIINKNKE